MYIILFRYLENVRSVDENIHRIYEKIEAFYKYDNRTTYIVTSDHGHRDWGGHGNAESVLTRSPFIAWGAGIASPMASLVLDEDAQTWKLGSTMRRDIQQVDISSILSASIGTPFPVNSIGKVPLNVFNVDNKTKSSMMMTNALQVFQQYQRGLGLPLVFSSGKTFCRFDIGKNLACLF